MYVLGIDGGGTKTAGIVADEFGTIYMQAVTGRSNPTTLSPQEFEQVMVGLVEELKTQNEAVFNQISVCFAGMAGVDESKRTAEVMQLLKTHLPDEIEVIVQNDAVNALYSGTLGKPGIAQISGTGSIAFGINEKGETTRAGGWGFLFDEGGSGFAIGKAALRAVFQAFDKRGPETSLTARLLEHFGVKIVPDIIAHVYGHEYARAVIAPLAQLVVNEALAGDKIAHQILMEACGDMLLCIDTCHKQLFAPDHSTAIVLAGGVFSDWALFDDLFKRLARGTLPNAVFQPTRIPPVGGAVIAGLKSHGITIREQFTERLNEQVMDAVNA
ncbi:N-acetylglucosamine kinase [Planococcus sp. YIM B11945]|uniref:N-acetylglucosamine kinase n=1 Tax=Planococcus sp. YIM B11945 TaxID=3435410 RepID=UPI003D7F1697